MSDKYFGKYKKCQKQRKKIEAIRISFNGVLQQITFQYK